MQTLLLSLVHKGPYVFESMRGRDLDGYMLAVVHGLQRNGDMISPIRAYIDQIYFGVSTCGVCVRLAVAKYFYAGTRDAAQPCNCLLAPDTEADDGDADGLHGRSREVEDIPLPGVTGGDGSLYGDDS